MARMGFIQDEMDLKLLVLYIMARIAAPITFLQLLELALCDAGVDYFSLTQAVEHLVETEHLSREGEILDHQCSQSEGQRITRAKKNFHGVRRR